MYFYKGTALFNKMISRSGNYQVISVLIMWMMISGSLAFAECQTQRVRLQVLGSGGPEMSDLRASSSYLLWLDNKAAVLVDAGPGSSLNFEKSGAMIADLDAVVFSHFHVDHSADFPVLIKASYFTNRNKDLMVLGPQGNNFMPSVKEFVNGLIGKKGVYRYLSSYVAASESSPYKIRTEVLSIDRRDVQSFRINDSLSLGAVAVHHGPIPALAWKIDVAGCKFVFSGDMNNQYQTLEKLAKASDVLIAHNAIPESADGVARNLHMPPSEIGKIAARSSVKKLVLSHRMLRTLGKEQDTLNIIKKRYQGPVVFAEDLDIVFP